MLKLAQISQLKLENILQLFVKADVLSNLNS
jgi:hypothetical protein